MKSTNRTWQAHLRAKGIVPFFMDRLQQHALSSVWQYSRGAFDFPVTDRETDDELSRAYFDHIEAFPYEFYLEITNNCNLDCTFCARVRMERARGVMGFDLYRKIIDEITEKQPHAFIHYYGIGESMVDKGLFKKLEYSAQKGLRNSLLFTNGQLLLHNDNYRRLADSGLTNIGVDVDAMSQETYAKIRVGGVFETTKRGIEKLYDYVRGNGLRVRVELAYQIVPDINENEVAPFVAWCGANGYEYKLVTMHNWAGLRDDVAQTQLNGQGSDVHHAERQNPCTFLWNGFTIHWDGRVPTCFMDANLVECLGDISTQTIEEIWTTELREKRRQQVGAIFSGLCRGCTSLTGVRLPAFHSSLYPEPIREPASP